MFLLVPSGCVKMWSASVTHHTPHKHPHHDGRAVTSTPAAAASLPHTALPLPPKPQESRPNPRSHHHCERHIHHRNQQHLWCFTPTHCPHRSHWRCLWSSIGLPPRWWITGALDMREAALGIALMCITVTECHRQRRWRVEVASSNGKRWDHSTTIHSVSCWGNTTINHWCFVGWGGEWCPFRGSNGRNDQIKQSLSQILTAGDYWLFKCWLIHQWEHSIASQYKQYRQNC
jgi:hypothetical protein